MVIKISNTQYKVTNFLAHYITYTFRFLWILLAKARFTELLSRMKELTAFFVE